MKITNEKEKKKRIFEFLPLVDGIFEEVRKVVVGQSSAISRVVLSTLSVGQLTPKAKGSKDSISERIGGSSHIFLEGVPGTAKTLLVLTMAQVCGGVFKRIQCTPDTVPSDILGAEILEKKGEKIESDLRKGPIFANFVLFDEVNRLLTRVQAASLEAMSSRTVNLQTLSEERTYSLPNPFLVLATQNPIEQEGTNPLSEAQRDRFGLKMLMAENIIDELIEIEQRHEHFDELEVEQRITLEQLREIREFIHHNIFISPATRRYAARLVKATNPFPFSEVQRAKYESEEKDEEFLEEWREIWSEEYDFVKGEKCKLGDLIKVGASPRAVIYLISLAKSLAFCRNTKESERDSKKGFRDYIVERDIKKMVNDVLRHRIVLSDRAYTWENYFGSMENLIDMILEKIIKKVSDPA